MSFKKLDIVGIIALVASSVFLCMGLSESYAVALLMANGIGIGMFLAFGWIK